MSSENPAAPAPVQTGDGGNPNNPEVTWWCKLLVKVIATIAGGICFVLGIWQCISISALCIVAGILQILVAVLVLIFEVPFCCQFFEVAKPIAAFFDRRSYMQKAFVYAGLAIPPVAMCFSASTIIGCSLVFATGVIYGLMALGKKADRETMMARAVDHDKAAIVPNIQLQP